ncbi:MAG: toxin-antitoxin system HicB family antitoxin [Candidatus Eisenbacteria bacterium]
MSKRSLEQYLSLKYPMRVTEREGLFEVEFPDLKGCIAHGTTPNKAYKNALAARREWLETAMELGIEIPEPRPEEAEDYSGRFLVRCTKALHWNLTQLAKRQGVSLNHLVASALSSYVGAEGALEVYWNLKPEVLPYSCVDAAGFGNAAVGEQEPVVYGHGSEYRRLEAC